METLSNQLIKLTDQEGQKVESGIFHNVISVKQALEKGAHNLMENRMVLLNKKHPYYIVGDIHSDEATLKSFLKKIDFYQRVERGESFQIVFLGDYVDRGFKHLETLECLVALKFNYPEYICLLRGNHDGGILLEDGEVQLPYRIPDEDDPMSYFPKYLQSQPDLLRLFLKWFDLLPYVAFIGDESRAVMCVHGGIIKPMIDSKEHYDYLGVLSDLTSTGERCDELFWSDPYTGEGERHLDKKRFKFTAENFFAFKEKLDIDLLIRGHEVANDGVRSHFDGTLFTLFSSGSSKDSYYKSVKPRYMTIDISLSLSTHYIHE